MRLCRIVERAVPEIAHLAQHGTDHDQRGAGDLGRAHLFADVRQRAAQQHLVGPAHAIGHHHRAIGPVMGHQHAFDLAQGPDAQMNGERRARAREIFQRLVFGHGGRFHRHPCQHDGLRHLGHRQFLPQRRRRRHIGGHARHDVIGDAVRAQPPDLFRDGPVERRITRMDPRHIASRGMGGDDLGMGFVQRHGRRVQHAPARGGFGHHLGGHERPGIKAHGAGPDQPQRLERQKFGVARTRADEMDGHRVTPPPCGLLPGRSRAGAARPGPACLRPASRRRFPPPP